MPIQAMAVREVIYDEKGDDRAASRSDAEGEARAEHAGADRRAPAELQAGPDAEGDEGVFVMRRRRGACSCR